MNLNKVTISNFRGYYNTIEIDIDDITAFVGRNDAGKSTILEALDIFFNEGKGVVKLDKNDLNIKRREEGCNDIEISCVFSDLPEGVIIDDSNVTSFQADYLLNRQRLLEIVKIYKMSTENPKPSIYIRAIHPTNDKCCDLLSKTQKQLKENIDNLNIACDDKCKNATMRAAIWNHYGDDLRKEEVLIEIASKKCAIWEKLRPILPNYSLFQSDRKNSDGDSEVQDPLKSALKQIFDNPDIRETLNGVAERVRKSLQQVSDATLEKLHEMSPEIAQTLHPQIPDSCELKWHDVFKGLSIAGDQNIPINKRGSGVKRLILLNFFRAEAERKLLESDSKSIIYAIEEPETSQHKENQKILIKALKELSLRDNTQILITTHSSDVVKSLSFDNIRIVDTTQDVAIRKILDKDKNILTGLPLMDTNFIVFGDASVEYHNYLYGKLMNAYGIDSIKKFNDLLICKQYSAHKTWKNSRTGKDEQVTIHTYIRNCIHHSENENNELYADEEIAHSIKEMRELWAEISSHSSPDEYAGVDI